MQILAHHDLTDDIYAVANEGSNPGGGLFDPGGKACRPAADLQDLAG
jgi:hypothetical protein